YKNSFLGFFWSLLNPLITVLVMTVVFKYFMKLETPSLSAYILAAYLPYVFFQMSVLDSAQSVVAALPIIRKVYFPRIVLPLAMIISNFVHLMLALGVFMVYLLGVYLLFPGQSPFQFSTLLLPVILLINFALAAGIGFIVSALNTFYEDVKYIMSVVMWLLLFLSPVMYFSENVWNHSKAADGGLTYFLYHLNPVAMLCTAYRKILIAPQVVDLRGEKLVPLPLDWTLLGITAATSVILLIVGFRLFTKLQWKFVERP
ncbi:MAG TPA: ABC transporter permease, partial [Fimbriimonadaceae bacterium]|nr:ABC transporter permease [Fimbriimonadaceae bacterium]